MSPGVPIELSREECLQLLADSSFGRIAVSTGDGAPIIRPVNYIFDERSQSVVFRTVHGTKLYALLGARQAALEIDAIDSDTRSGWSVIIVGVTERVTNPIEVRRLEQLGLDTWIPDHESHWLRIRAWTVSGRRIV
jgi:nitroimidazol reductase NimA-like FMN-containing flavoprotein (pyridoxamine 5'-phosphate oxidase superfamily)